MNKIKILGIIGILCISLFLGKSVNSELYFPACISNNPEKDYEIASKDFFNYGGLIQIDINTQKSIGGCKNGNNLGTIFRLKNIFGNDIGNIIIIGKNISTHTEFNNNYMKYFFIFYPFILLLIIFYLIYISYVKYGTYKKKKS